jgi:hypothetical protein
MVRCAQVDGERRSTRSEVKDMDPSWWTLARIREMARPSQSSVRGNALFDPPHLRFVLENLDR